MGAGKFTIAEYKPHLYEKLSLSTLWVNHIFFKLISQIPITIQLQKALFVQHLLWAGHL